LKANIASGTVVPSQSHNAATEQPAPPATERSAENQPIMIHFKNPSARPPVPAAEEEEEEDDSILDSDSDYVDYSGDESLLYVAAKKPEALQPGKLVYPVTPRKRPSQELEPDDTSADPDQDGDVFMDANTQGDLRRRNNGTPPKRARVDGGYEPPATVKSQAKQQPPSPTPSNRIRTPLVDAEVKKAKVPLPLPRTPGLLRVPATGVEGRNE